MKNWKILFMGVFVSVFLYPNLGWSFDGHKLKERLETWEKCLNSCSPGELEFTSWIGGYITGVSALTKSLIGVSQGTFAGKQAIYAVKKFLNHNPAHWTGMQK